MKKQERVATFSNCRYCDNADKPFGRGLAEGLDWKNYIWCFELKELVQTRMGEYPDVDDFDIPDDCPLDDA